MLYFVVVVVAVVVVVVVVARGELDFTFIVVTLCIFKF